MARAFLLLILSAAVAVSPMANALRSQIRTNLQFENGESVEVEWEGQWFRSMVNATVDAGVKISYDAGGAEVIPSAELVTRVRKIASDDIQATTTTTSRASRKRASSPDNYEPARKMPSYQQSCDEHNLMVLKERWRGLGKFDCWWPLTLDEDFWKDGVLSVNRKSWRVFGLQHALQIPLDEFSTLVEYGSLWSGGEKKTKWADIFNKSEGGLQFEKEIKTRLWAKVGQTKLKWVNFYQGEEAEQYTDPKHMFTSGYEGPSILDVTMASFDCKCRYTWELDYSDETEEWYAASSCEPESESSGEEPPSYTCAPFAEDTSADIWYPASDHEKDSDNEAVTGMDVEATKHDSAGATYATCLDQGRLSSGDQANEGTEAVIDTASTATQATQTNEHELLDVVKEVLRTTGGKLSKNDHRAAVLLVKSQEKAHQDGVRVVDLEGGRGFGRVSLLVSPNRKPGALKDDSDTEPRVVRRRSNILTWVTEQWNMGVRTLTRFLRAEKWSSFVEKSKVHAKLMTQGQMGVDATERVACCASTSYGALRRMRRECKKEGFYLASEKNIKQRGERKTKQVDTSMYRMFLEGTKGDSECLVYVANQMQLTMWLFDELERKGSFVDHWGDGRVVVSHTQDKGDGVGKHGIAIVNTKKPCAWYNIEIYCAVTPLWGNQKSKPNDSHANFLKVLPLVPWYGLIQHMSVVKVKGSHCLIPTESVPPTYTLPFIELGGEEAKGFLESAKLHIAYSAEAETAFMSVPKGCATVVTHDGSVLGVRAGSVCVAFLDPVPLSDESTAVCFTPDHTATLDLLALAEFLGMGGQSGVNSLFGRASGLANKRSMPENPSLEWGFSFKEAAAGQGLPLQPRTNETQAEDLETFRELVVRHPNLPHFMGVHSANILPCSVQNAFTPGLHLALGPGNKVEIFIKNELVILDSSHPVRTAEILSLKEKAEVAEAEFECAVGDLACAVDFDVNVADTCIADILDAAGKRAEELGSMCEALIATASGGVDISSAITPLQAQKDWFQTALLVVEEKKVELCKQISAIEELEKSNPAGVLAKYWDEIIATEGKITKQAYWKNVMHGPAVWLFFAHFPKLLTLMAQKITDEGFPVNVGAQFYLRHHRVLTPLHKACNLCRAARILKESEITELETACKDVGIAWRESYPSAAVLTPKLLALETDVPRMARIWKSIGLFGEDGMEAFHPKWREAMLMVRSMRNPEAKMKAGLEKLAMQARVHRSSQR